MSRNKLSDVIHEFVTAKLADGVTPRAAESYRYHLTRLASKQGLTALEDLTSATIRAYLVAMREEGLSPYTVYNAGKSIRIFSRWIESEGIAPSPWNNIRAPMFPNEAQPPFTKEDVHAILKAALTLRDRALVMLLLDTGLRLKEVTALTTDDLNMETGAVIVRKGKGGKFRTVFMGAKVRRAMSISLSYPSYFRQFVVLTLGSSIQVSFLGPSGCMRSCHSNLDLKQSDPGSYLGPSTRSMRCHSSFGFEVRFAIWFS